MLLYFNLLQRCQVVLSVRDLEQGVMTLTPDNIEMEGRTELTQYIVLSWNLDYINKSKNT